MVVLDVIKDKNKMRIIFDDGKFLLVDYSLVAIYTLYSGKIISKDIFTQLKNEQSVLDLYNYSISYLRKYNKSILDYKNHLIKKKINKKLMFIVMERLINKGYLNDSRYTESVVRILIRQGYGKYYIENKLRFHGIQSDIISEIDYNDNYLIFFNKIANKRLITYKKYSINEQKIKLSNYLKRRGYEFDLINEFIINI